MLRPCGYPNGLCNSQIAAINKINEREALSGAAGRGSWHDAYKDSAYVYVGGFPLELTEGDMLCVFSQFGEIEDINLVRDRDTGKSKGFCFIKYEDQRSTVLAVDNLNGVELVARVIRVDHVAHYKVPKRKIEGTDELELDMPAPLPVAPDKKDKKTKRETKPEEGPEPKEEKDPYLLAQREKERAERKERRRKEMAESDDPMAAYFAHKEKRERRRADKAKRA